MRRRDFLATLAAAVGCAAVGAKSGPVITPITITGKPTGGMYRCRDIGTGDEWVAYWDAEKKQYGPLIYV